MRLLVWFWSSGGGGSRFAVDLAARLSREAETQAALSLHVDDPACARAERAGIPVLRADFATGRRRPIRTLTGLSTGVRTIQAHIRAFGADAVLIAMNFAAAAPLSFAVDKPVVYFAHDPRPHPGDYSPLMQRVTQAALARRAEAVVALSDFGARQLPVPAHTVPLAAVYQPRVSPRVQTSAPVRLLLLGRLLAYKGLDLLAQALKGIERSDWRLTIAGAGKAPLERLALDRRVTVRREWLSDGEVEALFDSHDILIAPYRSATQSGAVAQAMAAGLPVIATRVGALEEQLAGTGWLAEPNSTSLSSAIERALDDRAYATRSAEALTIARRAAASNVFGWLPEVIKL